MIISVKDLKCMSIIRPQFNDAIRRKSRAVTINGFCVSGVEKFKIQNDMVFVCGLNDCELARIGMNTLCHLEMEKEFDDYKFVLKIS